MGFDSLMQTVKLSLVCPVNQDWQFGPGPSLEASPVGFRGPQFLLCGPVLQHPWLLPPMGQSGSFLSTGLSLKFQANHALLSM